MHIVRLKISGFRGVRSAGVALGLDAELETMGLKGPEFH
jgi:hypothetical protein